jgi:hypothetical protein
MPRLGFRVVCLGNYWGKHMLPYALLLIDVQQGFEDVKWGIRNNPHCETNIARLLADWRRNGRPVTHVQHRSTKPDSPLRPELGGCAFKSEAQPVAGEAVFGKSFNSAFIGTALDSYLGKVTVRGNPPSPRLRVSALIVRSRSQKSTFVLGTTLGASTGFGIGCGIASISRSFFALFRARSLEAAS